MAHDKTDYSHLMPMPLRWLLLLCCTSSTAVTVAQIISHVLTKATFVYFIAEGAVQLRC